MVLNYKNDKIDKYSKDQLTWIFNLKQMENMSYTTFLQISVNQQDIQTFQTWRAED